MAKKTKNDNTLKKTRRPRSITAGGVLAKCITALDKLNDSDRERTLRSVTAYYSAYPSSDDSLENELISIESVNDDLSELNSNNDVEYALTDSLESNS